MGIITDIEQAVAQVHGQVDDAIKTELGKAREKLSGLVGEAEDIVHAAVQSATEVIKSPEVAAEVKAIGLKLRNDIVAAIQAAQGHPVPPAE